MTKITHLSRAEFFALDDFMYFQEGRLTNEITEKEVNNILSLISKKTPQMIFDTPCGHGRHSLLFAEKGHHVTGIDGSPLYISIANEMIDKCSGKVDFLVGEMNTFIKTEHFDLVVNLFNSFGYYNHQTNLLFLKGCFDQLKHTGTLMIDTINAECIESSSFLEPVEITKGADQLTICKKKTTMQFEMGYRANYTIVSKRSNSCISTQLPVIFYTADELKSMLQEVGFTSINIYEDLNSLAPFTTSSKKMFFVAKK
jgi:2-polyprenyl-3-methyl-5-hydroxy-6-metoxy-1,4-benzoquinol methylase